MVNMIGNPEISPLVLCTPIHEFEFVPLEELENETPKVNPKVSSQQKLISKGVKNDSKRRILLLIGESCGLAVVGVIGKEFAKRIVLLAIDDR